MKNILLLLILSGLILSCKKTTTNNSSTEENSGELYTASDFTDSVFTGGIEGPMIYFDENIYAVNFQREGTIGLVKPNGKCELFVELPTGSTGNGIRFDSKGNMLIADYSAHNILKVNMNTKQISVYAHDASMNQPNDLTIMKNDIIFCSDPKWADNTGKLWRVNKDSSTTLLMDNLGTTNGIEISPDNKILYVNESVQRKVWKYDINENGDLLNKTLFITFQDGGMDGMKCDPKGNLYIARYDKGSIVKISPDGFLLKEIKLKGQKPTNLTFGGKDSKTIYVTMQDRGLFEKFTID